MKLIKEAWEDIDEITEYHLQYIDKDGNILSKEIYKDLDEAKKYGLSALKNNEKVESIIIEDDNGNELFYLESKNLNEDFEIDNIEDINTTSEEDISIDYDANTANIEVETTEPVSVKTVTSTSVEVLDNFTEVREEMAKDTYNQFKEGKLSVLDLNKRLAALCGSYEAGMKWLADHENEPVTEIEIIVEPTVEDNVELLNTEIEELKAVEEPIAVNTEVEEVEVVESLNESVKTLQKLAESSPEAKSAINHILNMLKEDINIDEVEIEVEAPEKKEESEAEKIADTPDMPNAGIENYIADALNTNIVGEWDTIKNYNDFVATLESTPEAEKYASIVNVIKDIANEEHTHIGQLQQALKLVSPNTISIAAGEVEGSKQIAVPADDGNNDLKGDTPTEQDLKKDTLLSPEEAKEEKAKINNL